tara:strand:- start:254 stop:1213 length:960 start_codon:yes stop_codon:yes gene_type:complete
MKNNLQGPRPLKSSVMEIMSKDQLLNLDNVPSNAAEALFYGVNSYINKKGNWIKLRKIDNPLSVGATPLSHYAVDSVSSRKANRNKTGFKNEEFSSDEARKESLNFKKLIKSYNEANGYTPDHPEFLRVEHRIQRASSYWQSEKAKELGWKNGDPENLTWTTSEQYKRKDAAENKFRKKGYVIDIDQNDNLVYVPMSQFDPWVEPGSQGSYKEPSEFDINFERQKYENSNGNHRSNAFAEENIAGLNGTLDSMGNGAYNALKELPVSKQIINGAEVGNGVSEKINKLNGAAYETAEPFNLDTYRRNRKINDWLQQGTTN